MTDALEKIIRPIVEGQIRGFLKEHPCIAQAVNWYKPRSDKATTLTNSLSKRIVRDLLCPTSRARLATALLELPAGSPSIPPVDLVTAADVGRLATPLGAPSPHEPVPR